MNELIAAFTTPYTMQSVNLMLTYTECYACIALFARRFERRDFFLVRIILTLLEGMVVCYLLAIWYTEADSLLVRVLCYSAITVSNFTALMFCWRDDIEEMLLAFCSGIAAYQFTNKLYPLLQNLRGINDRETLALLHSDPEISNLDWAIFFGFHLLSIVLLAALFTPKNRLVHNRRTTRNVIVLSIATVTLVNILICVSRVYEGESPMLNIVTKVLYVGFSFTILTICAGIFSQSEQEEQIGILHRHGARFHRRQRRRAREGVGIALDGGRRERSHLHGIGYEQKHAAHQRGVEGVAAQSAESHLGHADRHGRAYDHYPPRNRGGQVERQQQTRHRRREVRHGRLAAEQKFLYEELYHDAADHSYGRYRQHVRAVHPSRYRQRGQ